VLLKRYSQNAMRGGEINTGGESAKWTKRAGIIAFLFFLGKGLVWLGIAAAGVFYSLN
jgi:hypothetical protein